MAFPFGERQLAAASGLTFLKAKNRKRATYEPPRRKYQ
jgi:hypothetical protein